MEIKRLTFFLVFIGSEMIVYRDIFSIFPITLDAQIFSIFPRIPKVKVQLRENVQIEERRG